MSHLHLPVEEFTTPNPITATESATVTELKSLMTKHGIRHVPIVKGERVIGLVSDRDLRVVEGLEWQEKKQVRASDIMAVDPVTVSSETPLDEVAFTMSERKIGSVVVNEGDEFLGIFTVTDALNALIEIARDLQDEEEE
ncbi:MAG: CBS domain-containing protein [Bdellovibrionaceae bacterium]|nr:CBS domain-containing protein [Pseudobdellovibrionaceae bacterium]